MRVKKFIDIANIVVDRHSISPETFKLATYITEESWTYGGIYNFLASGKLPAIKVQKLNNGLYRLKDGRHRVTAFKLLGLKQIEAKFFESDKPRTL